MFIKCINKICCSRAAGGAGVQQQGEAVQGALRGARDGRPHREVLLLQLQPLQHCQQQNRQGNTHNSHSTVLILCDCSEILRKKMQSVTLAAVSPHPFAAASLGLQWRIVGCNDLWCGAGDDDACHDT